MAIYHLHAKTGQKGKQSAAASAAYITRKEKYANRPGIVLATGSGHMPAWAKDAPLEFWRAADKYERANGRLFKSIECALPRELDAEQQVELARKFCEEVTLIRDGKLPYTFAVHSDSENHNPHLHLMISERITDTVERGPERHFKRFSPKTPSRGGARKTEALKPQLWLATTRVRWAELANQALAQASQPARIDHRTLKAQNMGITPGFHIGPNVLAMKRRNIRSWKLKKYDKTIYEREKNLRIEKITYDKKSRDLYFLHYNQISNLINNNTRPYKIHMLIALRLRECDHSQEEIDQILYSGLVDTTNLSKLKEYCIVVGNMSLREKVDFTKYKVLWKTLEYNVLNKHILRNFNQQEDIKDEQKERNIFNVGQARPKVQFKK